jgi:hypothetical protein
LLGVVGDVVVLVGGLSSAPELVEPAVGIAAMTDAAEELAPTAEVATAFPGPPQ